jgi:P4 family phage/plasmid primase-like protien
VAVKAASKSWATDNNLLPPGPTNQELDIGGGKFGSGKLPESAKQLKQLSLPEFDLLIKNACSRAGFVLENSRDRQKLSDAWEDNQDTTAAGKNDDRFQWLFENGHSLGTGRFGQLFIECPFKDGHSVDSGHTETAYFPAGTGGYHLGHYKCMHASCRHRSDEDFDIELGYPGEEVSDVFDTHFNSDTILVDPHDHMRTARLLLDREFSESGSPTLVRVNGSWFAYIESRYRECSEETIRSAIWRFLELARSHDKRAAIRITPTLVGAVAEALRAVAPYLEDTVTQWLDGRRSPSPRDIIALKDGLFDVKSRKLLSHTPSFFNLNVLPFNAPTENDKATRWRELVKEIWPGDIAAQQTFQEIVGYMVTGDTSLQKAFLMVGVSRSGKGVIARVLKELLGEDNFVGPTMSGLAGGFGLESLIGKLAAVIPDARLRRGQYSPIVVERILMISGEDTVTVDRKNKTAWTGKLPCRIMIISNEVPKLHDSSGAIAGRFISLEMRVSFYGREDKDLTDKLITELSGIFAWSLDGLERLTKRGYFLQPESGMQLSEDLSELGNPLRTFARECCTFRSKCSASVDRLYQAYRTWCAKNGHYPAAKNSFSTDFGVAFPRLKRIQPRVGESRKQVKSFGGIILREDINDDGDDGDDGVNAGQISGQRAGVKAGH